MKGNNGSGNIASRDTWQTPQRLWNKLDEEYRFNMDCCASIENKKTLAFYSDFKVHDRSELLNRICWMNPPFSKAYEMFKHFFKVVDQGVAIYRCDNMETKIWQDIILKHADWIFIPKGRISYEGMEGRGSRFPSALIGVGVRKPKLNNGCILDINKIKYMISKKRKGDN